MPDIAALPLEVLENVVAKLPSCQAIQLQRTSWSFWRAVAAGEELDAHMLDKLLIVLGEDGQSGQAALAACMARRWLARNARGVKLVCTHTSMEGSSWISLVSYLPALQDVTLRLTRPLVRDDLGCLLEALAGCYLLRAVDLSISWREEDPEDEALEDVFWRFPDAAAFAKLRSLTKLSLSYDEHDLFCSFDIGRALVPLTGLVELSICAHQAADIPAALGELKSLRSLVLQRFGPFEDEEGFIDLPKLISLEFQGCYFEEDALPGISALRCLTRIELSGYGGPCFFDPGLVQLPALQRLVLSQYLHDDECHVDDVLHTDGIVTSPGLPILPADMGPLRSSLLQLDISAFVLPHFPLALTQLVALEFLDATYNHCAELPGGITALSRLTELRLGRLMKDVDPLQLQQDGMLPLDVCALGDLSGFPALREVTLKDCQVILCPLLLGAVRYASLTTVFFICAYPAPECAPMVLQLSQELRRLRRDREIRYRARHSGHMPGALGVVQGLTPCQKFGADLNACGL